MESGRHSHEVSHAVTLSLQWEAATTVESAEGEATGLLPATSYRFRIIATNAEGDSSNGEESIATTLADRPAAPAPPTLTGNNPTTVKVTARLQQSFLVTGEMLTK